jgi:hypothetical protein
MRGQPVKLPKDAARARRVWVEIGRPDFELAEHVFQQVVRNFRADLNYRAGRNGRGAAPVVPWDFEHASERNTGELAVAGAPAQGWIYELELRETADGTALWALTEWFEPARGYVKTGRYRWASVHVVSTIDTATGERIGATLTSVALTNRPGIKGLAPATVAARPQAETGFEYGRRLVPMKVDASAAPGRTSVEKAVSALCAQSTAFASLPRRQQVERAKVALSLGTVRVGEQQDFEPGGTVAESFPPAGLETFTRKDGDSDP